MDRGDLVGWDIGRGAVEPAIDEQISSVDPGRRAEPLQRGEPVPLRVLRIINFHAQLLGHRVGPAADDHQRAVYEYGALLIPR